MKVPINRDLLDERIRTLHISERRLTDLARMPMHAVRAAKREGHFDGRITLAELTRLADVLAVDVRDLLTPPTTPQDNEETTGSPDNLDVTQLISLLLGKVHVVDEVAFANLLGWDLPRIDRALRQADAALASGGLTVHRSRGTVRIISRANVDPDLKARARQMRLTREGLSLLDGNTLKRIIEGKMRYDRNPGNGTKVSLGALKNMGCTVERGDQPGTYVPSPALRLALPDLT